jgi:hypothetical protein
MGWRQFGNVGVVGGEQRRREEEDAGEYISRADRYEGEKMGRLRRLAKRRGLGLVEVKNGEQHLDLIGRPTNADVKK